MRCRKRLTKFLSLDGRGQVRVVIEECRREGAKPPPKISPPLKQIYFLSRAMLLFERGSP